MLHPTLLELSQKQRDQSRGLTWTGCGRPCVRHCHGSSGNTSP